jgi:hypothetical protein
VVSYSFIYYSAHTTNSQTVRRFYFLGQNQIMARQLMPKVRGLKAMSKTQISRDELTHKALAAIRQVSGCEGVTEISLSPATIVNDGSVEWHIDVIDAGTAKPELAYRAAGDVADMLAARYEFAET